MARHRAYVLLARIADFHNPAMAEAREGHVLGQPGLVADLAVNRGHAPLLVLEPAALLGDNRLGVDRRRRARARQLLLKFRVTRGVRHISRATANIPPKRNRKPCFSKRFYCKRNPIERFLSKLERFRRFATGYDKLAANFLAMVQLASTRLWLTANAFMAKGIAVTAHATSRSTSFPHLDDRIRYPLRQRRLGVRAGRIVNTVAALALANAAAQAQEQPTSVPITAKGNPIIRDGSLYSADPAPLVVGDTLYVITGRDEAPRDVAAFTMHEWELLATDDPASGKWRLYPHFLRPDTLFAWATPNAAWAAQIVRGGDGRFYLYAPVEQAQCGAPDCMGIGVARADSPLGPWRDLHPSGPIASQRLPGANTIQNIDPTVWVDDDGRAYMYWGTFGQLRGAALGPDMVTVGPPVDVKGLTGFFEAPWLFKRKGTYYLVYAANNAGPNSPCTHALYHACQAYGTAPTPLGPWTYRGVILGPVSSTTSHQGMVDYKGQWYMTYHTADAKDGGHFRRSVAIDRVEWDDSVSPPPIRKVVPTRPAPDRTPTRNVARAAQPSAFNQPVPVQYRLEALNDGRIYPAPLPPDLWGSWTGRNDTARGWIQYRWAKPMRLTAARLWFWGDHPAGAREGVAPPRGWHLEYWTGTGWRPVQARAPYPVAAVGPSAIRFAPVTTRCLRAVLDASGDARGHAAFGVAEWEVDAVQPVVPPAEPPTGLPDCG